VIKQSSTLSRPTSGPSTAGSGAFAPRGRRRAFGLAVMAGLVAAGVVGLVVLAWSMGGPRPESWHEVPVAMPAVAPASPVPAQKSGPVAGPGAHA